MAAPTTPLAALSAHRSNGLGTDHAWVRRPVSIPRSLGHSPALPLTATIVRSSHDRDPRSQGGNHFVLSGSLNGSQIFGRYPSGLADDAALNIGRGRIIPTSSWEAIWAPLAHWFGVEEAALPDVLPNMNNFDNIITKAELFKVKAA